MCVSSFYCSLGVKGVNSENGNHHVIRSPEIVLVWEILN